MDVDSLADEFDLNVGARVYITPNLKAMLLNGQIQGIEDTEGNSLSDFVNKAVKIVNELPDISLVLMLGGGTFSIPRMVDSDAWFNTYEPNMQVIELAKRYFGPTRNVTPTSAVLGNLPTEPYDLVIVDLPYTDIPEIATLKYQNRLLETAPRVIYNALDYMPPQNNNTTIHELAGDDWYLVDIRRENVRN